MIKIYIDLIKKCKMEIEDVPLKWREQVRVALGE